MFALWVAIAFMQLALLGGGIGWLLAALFVGAACGAAIERPVVALVAGSAASVLGSVWGILTLNYGAVSAALPKLPESVFANVLGDALLGWFVPVLKVSVYTQGPTPGAIARLAAAVIAAAGGSWLVSRSALHSPSWRRASGWLAAAIPVIVLAMVVGNPASGTNLKTPLGPGDYAYDGAIYRATYENMLSGTGYYDALVAAAAGDTRLATSGAVVGARFVDFIKSAPQMRMPYPFILWRAVAPAGSVGVMKLAAFVLGGVMLFAYYVLEKRVGAVGALASCGLLLVALPVVTWEAVFFTEWWAGIVTVLAILLWLRGWRVAAVIAALGAAIFRDVALVAVVMMGIGSLVAAVRPGDVRHGPAVRRWSPLIASVGALAAFAGLYALHVRQAAPFIVQAQAGTSTVMTMLASSAKRDLIAKAVNPAEFAQATLWFSGLWIAAAGVLQVPGWWFGIADADATERLSNRIVTAGLGAFWLAVVLTVGATSPQWGMLFMPTAVVGTALLPASCELLGLGAGPEVADDAGGTGFALGA